VHQSNRLPYRRLLKASWFFQLDDGTRSHPLVWLQGERRSSNGLSLACLRENMRCGVARGFLRFNALPQSRQVSRQRLHFILGKVPARLNGIRNKGLWFSQPSLNPRWRQPTARVVQVGPNVSTGSADGVTVSVTYVAGTFCYLCVRSGPQNGGAESGS